MGKTTPKVPFFKDSGCCPKIQDYTLHLFLGKFEFDRCAINDNVEVLKKELRKFQRLPLSSSSSISSSNSNNDFTDQLFIATSKRFKDPLQEAKKN